MAFSFKQSNKFTQGNSNYNDYYSPERTPLQDSSKLTPKSILRESLGSGSKSKKNIIINENLNKTRNLSHRSESQDDSEGININKALFRELGYGNQNERPKSALNQRYGENSNEPVTASSAFKTPGNDKYRQEGKSPIYLEDNAQGLDYNTGSNLLNIPKHNLSDFQKAYIKKLQREKEQAKYYEMMNKSNKTLTQGSIIDKPDVLNETDQNKTTQTKLDEENSPSLNTQSVQGKGLIRGNLDKNEKLKGSPNLNHIENKISHLEQSLDVYSKRLQASIDRKREHLGKGYEFINGERELRDAKTKGVEEGRILHKASLQTTEARDNKRSKNIYSQNREEQREEGYKGKIDESSLKKSQVSDRKERMNEKNKSKEQDEYSNRKNLENKPKQSKEENQTLRSNMTTLKGKDNKGSGISKQTSKKDAREELFDKEQELLKTIDQIREKLSQSLSKKTLTQKNNESYLSKLPSRNTEKFKTTKPSSAKENTQDSLQKVYGDVSNIKVQQVRKAYGAEKLKIENSYILDQGLSTSYNGFHWNADQSLKISKII